ncbi:Carboxymethylenebutenolidase like protein [Pteropus alecto]|uniref:Carboxymethylenebutenolidase homolog n=1 Tax=Pteropus alecto TaxID=9402 RepID=L5KFG6_PTEAL|nr:Carboxymethylenebutenolidase like protein [Pteropus alecto]
MANEANPCPCDIGHKMEYGGMGCEVQVEHIKAYVTRSPVNTGKAVIVIQDVFGWQLPNTRYMADMIAGNGYTRAGLEARCRRPCPFHCEIRDGLAGCQLASWSRLLFSCGENRQRNKFTNECLIRDSEDVHCLKNPTLFIFAENDPVIPLEQVSLLTQKLKEHCKVEYQIKTFSGQTHGFVHRKREDCSPEDKPYIEEARRNLLEWLNKYV